MKYRRAKGYPEFLAECDDIVLHDLYLWVRISEEKEFKAWSEFVAKYTARRGKGKNRATFILERKSSERAAGVKGLQIFSFPEYIASTTELCLPCLRHRRQMKRALSEAVLPNLRQVLWAMISSSVRRY